MTFAEYLEVSGETQVSFAKRCGLSQGYLSRLQRGVTFPHRKTILLVENATDGAVRAQDWFDAMPAGIAPSDVGAAK